MYLQMIVLVQVFSNTHLLTQPSATKHMAGLGTLVGGLRLSQHYGLHPAMARTVFQDTTYQGQEQVRRRIRSQEVSFIRVLAGLLEQHQPSGKIRLL